MGESGDRFSLPVFPGPHDSEAYMQAHATTGTVWQIVHLLSSTIAHADWRLYLKPTDRRVRYSQTDTGSNQQKEILKHAARTCLHHPNAFTTRTSFFELSQMYLDLTGECYWVVEYDQRANFPIGLWNVRPDRMEPVPDPDNFLAGYVYTSPDGQEKIRLDTNEVIFTRYPNPLDPYHGIGPIQSVLVDIDASRYSSQWNRNFFINSAIPGGIITVPNALKDEQYNELTDRWRESHRGVGRAHRVAVLENGATWAPAQSTAIDMDFVNLRNMGRDIIREAFGVPKVMLGVTDDVNRANAMTSQEVFNAWKVIPRLDRWKDVINHVFLPLFGSSGEGVEFDYQTPLPPDREAANKELIGKAQSAQFLVSAGYDPHDVLEVVGLPDMDVVEQAIQAPALPPGWVAEQKAADQASQQEAQDDQQAEMANRLRKILMNGHQPVEVCGITSL